MALRNTKLQHVFEKPTPGMNVMQWLDAGGHPRSETADQSATGFGLHEAQYARAPSKYQHRRHYQGFYWFAGTGKHVFHESMTEYSSLMQLDHSFDIRAVAAQPMCLDFADGSRHFPDYFAVHHDGLQVLYDVKPLAHINDKVRIQFANTREFCAKVGWAYEILHGCTGVARHNLEWIAAYRHSRYQPDQEAMDRILSLLEEPIPLLELAELLDFKNPSRYVHHIYSLIWSRHLLCDFIQPLNNSTVLRKSSYA